MTQETRGKTHPNTGSSDRIDALLLMYASNVREWCPMKVIRLHQPNSKGDLAAFGTYHGIKYISIGSRQDDKGRLPWLEAK